MSVQKWLLCCSHFRPVTQNPESLLKICNFLLTHQTLSKGMEKKTCFKKSLNLLKSSSYRFFLLSLSLILSLLCNRSPAFVPGYPGLRKPASGLGLAAHPKGVCARACLCSGETQRASEVQGGRARERERNRPLSPPTASTPHTPQPRPLLLPLLAVRQPHLWGTGSGRR